MENLEYFICESNRLTWHTSATAKLKFDKKNVDASPSEKSPLIQNWNHFSPEKMDACLKGEVIEMTRWFSSDGNVSFVKSVIVFKLRAGAGCWQTPEYLCKLWETLM